LERAPRSGVRSRGIFFADAQAFFSGRGEKFSAIEFDRGVERATVVDRRRKLRMQNASGLSITRDGRPARSFSRSAMFSRAASIV